MKNENCKNRDWHYFHGGVGAGAVSVLCGGDGQCPDGGRVLSGSGVMADIYPLTVSSYPQETPIGRRCSLRRGPASAVFTRTAAPDSFAAAKRTQPPRSFLSRFRHILCGHISDIVRDFDYNKRAALSSCGKGRIMGAFKVGNSWTIPVDAKKTDDERIKSGLYIKKKNE